jgi:hypothetical protein
MFVIIHPTQASDQMFSHLCFSSGLLLRRHMRRNISVCVCVCVCVYVCSHLRFSSVLLLRRDRERVSAKAHVCLSLHVSLFLYVSHLCHNVINKIFIIVFSIVIRKIAF